MAGHPVFPPNELQALCDVLGETDAGLTGSEIERLLASCQIGDPAATKTKRHRLFEALKARQDHDRGSNAELHFVQETMAPVRYRGDTDIFDSRRQDVNEVLAFAG